MEQLGAKPLERSPLNLVSNEMIVVPVGNSILFQLPADRVEGYSQYRCQAAKWMAVMNVAQGAGYYSDGWGPAPFVFGSAPFESYYVFRVK
jgi:hypothetical protein